MKYWLKNFLWVEKKKSQKERVKYFYCNQIFRTQCGTSNSSRNTLARADDSHMIAGNFVFP